MRPTLVLDSPKVGTMVRYLSAQQKFWNWLAGGAADGAADDSNVNVTRTALRYVTVSGLLRVWGAANMHTTDGSFRATALDDIDDIAGIPCFGKAMEFAGWATVSGDGLVFPNFLEHNNPERLRLSETKSNAQRQREFRARQRSLLGDPLEMAVTDRNARNAKKKKENKKKNISLSKERDSGHDPKLLEIIASWAMLKQPVVLPGNGVTIGKPTKAALAAWKRARDDPEVRGMFDDVTAIFQAIDRATFCHGQGWFSMVWLFSKNSKGEWNIRRLLGGCFDQSGPAKRSRASFRPFSEVARDRGIVDE